MDLCVVLSNKPIFNINITCSVDCEDVVDGYNLCSGMMVTCIRLGLRIMHWQSL